MIGKYSILPGCRCVCCHVFCSWCSCSTPCRWNMTAAFIAYNLNECLKSTSILSHTFCIWRVMLRIPGLISNCVLWTYNISSHEQGKEFEEVFLKVGKTREWMGLQCREWTAEAESWIPHSLTIEDIICTAFVSIQRPLIKRLDYKE